MLGCACLARFSISEWRWRGQRVYIGGMATMAQPRVDEEAIIREKIAEVPLPVGVKFKSLEPMTEWTGEEAWRVIYTVSTRYPLTKKRLRALGTIEKGLSKLILPLWFWQVALRSIPRGQVAGVFSLGSAWRRRDIWQVWTRAVPGRRISVGPSLPRIMLCFTCWSRKHLSALLRGRLPGCPYG